MSIHTWSFNEWCIVIRQLIEFNGNLATMPPQATTERTARGGQTTLGCTIVKEKKTQSPTSKWVAADAMTETVISIHSNGSVRCEIAGEKSPFSLSRTGRRKGCPLVSSYRRIEMKAFSNISTLMITYTQDYSLYRQRYAHLSGSRACVGVNLDGGGFLVSVDLLACFLDSD